jgi:hypothetical protein
MRVRGSKELAAWAEEGVEERRVERDGATAQQGLPRERNGWWGGGAGAEHAGLPRAPYEAAGSRADEEAAREKLYSSSGPHAGGR